MARIFIIEDHPQLRSLLVRVFHQLGHDVLAFSNGGLFLDESQQPDFIKPDVIVTDHLMPRTTGLETLRRLRERPELAQIPVIVFSAIDDDSLKKQFFQAGAVDFIVKGSIGIKELEHYIRKHSTPTRQSPEGDLPQSPGVSAPTGRGQG
jgi:CheY-like chemotaxis protein